MFGMHTPAQFLLILTILLLLSMRPLSMLLADISSPVIVQGSVDISISAVRYDCAMVEPGDMFVAAPDLEIEHEYTNIQQALARGAQCIVSSQAYDSPSHTYTMIRVPDGRIALAEALYSFHDNPQRSMNIYGITGTNGKTTSTFMLRALLEEAGETTGLIGTTGNYIRNTVYPTNFSTPEAHLLCDLFVRMRSAGVRAVVMETTSHGMELERVAAIPFAGTIFTNLTQDHLDFHGSMENYARAKKKLFDRMKPHSIAIVNRDSSYADFMIQDCPAHKIFTFGRNESADIRISNEILGLEMTEFLLQFAPHIAHPRLLSLAMNFIGRFNVENATGCLALCRALGIDASTLQRGMARATGAPGRMQRIVVPGHGLAVVDFAHSPDSLEKALATCRIILQETESTGKIFCVFGCGGDRDRTKRPQMGAIASHNADYVMITSDNPRFEDPASIIADIIEGIPPAHRSNVEQYIDRGEAVTQALRRSRRGDIVLIAGKGHEEYQIIGKEYVPYSDVNVVMSMARQGGS
jgi:UDP-N-acetylmuramoyl-L-alanyl-D-glutamate--2,6-diaminopimelate ligase